MTVCEYRAMSCDAVVDARVECLDAAGNPEIDACADALDTACNSGGDTCADSLDASCNPEVDACVDALDTACNPEVDACADTLDDSYNPEVDARVDALGIICKDKYAQNGEEKIELDVDSEGEVPECHARGTDHGSACQTHVGPEEGEWASLVDHECDVDFMGDVEMPAANLAAQARAASESSVRVPGPRTPPRDVGFEAMVLERLNDLQGRYVQLKDVVDRLEMIFNQSVGRLDDQLNAQITHSKRNTAAVFEIRGVIQALVAEVGEEAVKARIQAMQQQAAVRQHELFGGGGFSGRPRGPQRYPDQNAGGGWNRQTRDEVEGGFAYQNGGEQWKRKGRGGGRRNY